MIINFKVGVITGILFLIVFIPLIQTSQKYILDILTPIKEDEKVLFITPKILSLNLMFIFFTGFSWGVSIFYNLYLISIGAQVNPSSYPGLSFLIFMNLCLISIVFSVSFNSLIVTNYRILGISSLKIINKFSWGSFEIYLNNINYFKYLPGGILSEILVKTKDKKGFRLSGYKNLSKVNDTVSSFIQEEKYVSQ